LSIARQLAAAPVRTLAIGIKHALDVTALRFHDADAREPWKARQILANHKRKPSVLVFE
jgi:hypothetical protein